MKRYFITVEKCQDGERGLLCSKDGVGYPKDNEPHSLNEMNELLGLFSIILDPKSELMTEKTIKEYTCWKSLSEYNHILGIGCKDLKNRVCVVPTSNNT